MSVTYTLYFLDPDDNETELARDVTLDDANTLAIAHHNVLATAFAEPHVLPIDYPFSNLVDRKNYSLADDTIAYRIKLHSTIQIHHTRLTDVYHDVICDALNLARQIFEQNPDYPPIIGPMRQ